MTRAAAVTDAGDLLKYLLAIQQRYRAFRCSPTSSSLCAVGDTVDVPRSRQNRPNGEPDVLDEARWGWSGCCGCTRRLISCFIRSQTTAIMPASVCRKTNASTTASSGGPRVVYFAGRQAVRSKAYHSPTPLASPISRDADGRRDGARVSNLERRSIIVATRVRAAHARRRAKRSMRLGRAGRVERCRELQAGAPYHMPRRRGQTIWNGATANCFGADCARTAIWTMRSATAPQRVDLLDGTPGNQPLRVSIRS